jgi:signal transduction histidine kinase
MNIRSLRWRLILAMVLIIAAVAATSGLFSSVTVKRELDRFLIAQRRDDALAALQLFRTHDVDDAMRRAHEQFGFRSLIMEGDRVVRFYPPEMSDYRVRVLPDGGLELTRNGPRGLEALRIQGMTLALRGVGRVHLLPPREGGRQEGPGAPRALRASVDRRLIAGLGIAALLAVGVMLTIFRRVFRPVEALTEGARALAGGRLDARVPVHGNDEVAELGRAFNSMAEALERNERSRRSMVSDVAHELRTPLTVIQGQTEGLLDGLYPADREHLEPLLEETRVMSRLLNDLLTLSTAEAGALQLHREPVTPQALVHEAVEAFQGPAALAGVTLDSHVNANLPTLDADPVRIGEVLANLLSNALRHSPSGGRISVSAESADGAVAFVITDTGSGIAPDALPHVFDRFVKAADSSGAGLGLAIAKSLVQAHGGTISAESSSGAGTTMRFVLPAEGSDRVR